MTSNNLPTTNNNNNFSGQFSFFPSIAAQYGIPAKIQTIPDIVPSVSSETSAGSLSSPTWDATSGLQIPIQDLTDYDNSNLYEDSDSSSTTSNLLKSSKKINKSSQDPNKQVTANRRPNRRRNPWSAQEDAKLLDLMRKHGQCWAIISSSLPGRTGKQVRDRYVNNLAPGLECGNWTPEEDDLVERLRNENGNKWSFIASHLPGRSEAQVKNRYYSFILKKRNAVTFGTNQACYFQNGPESPTASPQIEMISEPETLDAEFDFDIDNVTPVCPINNSEVMGNNHILSNVPVTSLTSAIISDEERISYGNVIRIPFFPGTTERFANPLSLISNQSSDKSCSNQCDKQTEGLFEFTVDEDCQIDGLIEHVVDCIDIQADDIGMFLADDLRKEESDIQISSEIEFQPSQREIDLRKRRAYLEMMLAETIKEMQDL